MHHLGRGLQGFRNCTAEHTVLLNTLSLHPGGSTLQMARCRKSSLHRTDQRDEGQYGVKGFNLVVHPLATDLP